MILAAAFPGSPLARLDESVGLFLAEHPHPVERACLAVAGPESGGRRVATLDGSDPVDVAVLHGGAPGAEGSRSVDRLAHVLGRADEPAAGGRTVAPPAEESEEQDGALTWSGPGCS
jgi:hypothetical protein